VTLRTAVADYVTTLCAQRPKVATRKASEMALNVLTEIVPDMIGGSADLTGSNNTRAGGMTPVSATDYGANYIHYGIREHGMGAAMNGMALHGGLRPYGGTFLVFSDYCRPAMRLSALMGVPVPYVMTHDSIGLGEDGPTHQPVEHLASLRAMPNMLVMRPCDAVETAEAWEVAMTQPARPSTLALSRQNLPVLRDAGAPKDNMTARGAYVLREAEGPRDITLIATGSEVEIAIDAAEDLAVEGIQAAVVSAPCFELFADQDADYRAKVLGTAPRIGVEAAIRQGWDAMLRSDDTFIGMTGFGASAPAAQLYQHFGITSAAVINAARAYLS
jgi:transketolase